MMRVSSKRGSAILIVLGMLSFMVVSAVGFAVFMRQSRLPSSYLRRASSSRYLLKAALANAIARIDGCYAEVPGRGGRCEGILDDPYPGVGAYTGDSAHRDDGNYWPHRVFTPFGPVSWDDTVSTLTLEGLAYLPPAIINEARVFSRTTRTAQWRNLSYDAGRYAFTAFDVSDCFDINKLFANERRFSAANQRVNLSSLFPNNGAQLDTILEKCSKVANRGNIPFVSVADFNIVAGNSPFSPFCRHIASGNSVSIYNQGDYQSVSNALFITDTWFPPTNGVSSIKRVSLASRQPFKSFNLQSVIEMARKSGGNMDAEIYRVLVANLGGAGLACLYDYLDKDRVPISLALPTVETEPMVCGIAAVPNLKFEKGTDPEATRDQNAPGVEISAPGAPEKITVKRTVTPHILKAPAGSTIMVSGIAAFPFKRVGSATNRKGNWKVDTLVAVFFAKSDLRSRLNDGSPLRPFDRRNPSQNHWDESWLPPGSAKVDQGIIWMRGPRQNLTFPQNITRTQDALQAFAVPVTLRDDVQLPICYEVNQTMTKKVVDTGVETQMGNPWTKFTCDRTRNLSGSQFLVYEKDGLLTQKCKDISAGAYNERVWVSDDDIKKNSGQDCQNWTDISDSTEFRPHIAVWVRILDSNAGGRRGGDATVDLVPATAMDDGLNGDVMPADALDEFYKMGGGGVPVLNFKADHTFKFVKTESADEFASLFDNASLQLVDWETLYAVDPRYNFAPEDWFGTRDKGADPAKWRGYVGADNSGVFIGKEGRDPDIFMFTSDQEYLQSIGELAFLPRVQEMNGNGDFLTGEFTGEARYHGNDNGSPRGNSFNQRSPTSNLGGFANSDYFWYTYSPVDHGDGSDDLYALSDGTTRYEFLAGDGGFRVNPYSPDSRVLMAALKDTPYDYFVASTNDVLNPTAGDEPSDRRRWAFCEESSAAKLSEDELLDMASVLSRTFESEARQKTSSGKFPLWEDIYDNLSWYDGMVGDEQKSIFENSRIDDPKVVELDEPLHGVDRKFLYSYWRECFQNRQQLFLLFLRAEALTVGGSGSNACGSSQLGARGVALVWRDPQPPTRGGSTRLSRSALSNRNSWDQYYKNFSPHRTRVLFYHQFD